MGGVGTVTRRSDDKERAASHLITGGNASKTSSLSLLRHRDHTKKGRFLIMKSLVSLEQCREAALSPRRKSRLCIRR